LFISPLRIPRPKQIQAIETIKAVDWIEIIHIDKKLDNKMWSLVDCASFVVMKERQLSHGFTTDHHFEQAGFVRLLK